MSLVQTIQRLWQGIRKNEVEDEIDLFNDILTTRNRYLSGLLEHSQGHLDSKTLDQLHEEERDAFLRYIGYRMVDKTQTLTEVATGESSHVKNTG